MTCRTPLHRVALLGDEYVDVARFLISRKAHLDAVDIYGNTPLLSVLENGAKDKVAVNTLGLLLDSGCDPHVTDSTGEGIWDKVTQPADVRALLARGVSPPSDILRRAVSAGRDGLVQVLMEDHVVSDGVNPALWLPAIADVRLWHVGHAKAARHLVAHGVNVPNLDALLELTSAYGYSHVVEHLQEVLIAGEGDHVGKVAICQTALDIAMTYGHRNVAEVVLMRPKSVPPVEVKVDPDAFDDAVVMGHYDILHMLDAMGLAPAVKQPFLFSACQALRPYAVKALLEMGARASETDDAGCTALWYAYNMNAREGEAGTTVDEDGHTVDDLVAFITHLMTTHAWADPTESRTAVVNMCALLRETATANGWTMTLAVLEECMATR